MSRRSSLLLAVSLALAGCSGSSGSSALPQPAAAVQAPAAAPVPSYNASHPLQLRITDAGRAVQSGWGGFSTTLYCANATCTATGTVDMGYGTVTLSTRQTTSTVSGAIVIATNAAGSVVASAMTDATGSFKLSVPNGQHVLTAYALY